MSNNELINVRGTMEFNDPYYRYKMEKVDLTKQGIKYVFNNVDKISTSLKREPNNLVSFLKKYFGSPFKYKNNVVTTTKKDLTQQILQDAVYRYIESEILCKKCKLPETVIKKEKKKTYICCEACSDKYEI